MAVNEILSRLNFIKYELNAVGILVIGDELFSSVLCEAFQKCNTNTSYKLYFITCADIKQVLYYTNSLPAECVIFLLDTKLKSCATDVEFNLQRMDKSFLCARTYIVNVNPHIPESETNENINSLTALMNKYDVPVLNGNIMNPKTCENLAQRLLILIKANLGIEQKTPFLPWIFKENK